jgi:Ni,Fe-hydrogenase III large subunit/Ni,Fe-hydrogenase III component G
MLALKDLIDHGEQVTGHYPWPRVTVDEESWKAAAQHLADGKLTLLGLWADGSDVHQAVLDNEAREIAVLTYRCHAETYPSVAALHPPAQRLERAIRSLNGLEPIGLPDTRPWIDLGLWDGEYPRLADRKAPSPAKPYVFLPAEGENLHQIPVGPVHAGIIEPGHFRFTASGETVVRLEQRLGYVHKGIESLMSGTSVERAAKLAGRTSGDSTVAYAWAYCQAVEHALEITVPRRAVFLRALMAELERLANHLGDIGAICNDASFSIMHANCGILRELVLRASDTCFGHRLMMDCIVPGGVEADLAAAGIRTVMELLDGIRTRLPQLIELYDNTASLQDRTVTTGIVSQNLVRQFGAGGFVGRASGRNFDARRTPGYRPYDRLRFDVPVLQEGDVNARVWIRIREVEQSLALIDQIVRQISPGPIHTELEHNADGREGIALVEAFRGDVLAWVRIADGLVERCHLRDASWFQWPLLEAAIEGNIVADFPLCNKSFNCSYSGHDL